MLFNGFNAINKKNITLFIVCAALLFSGCAAKKSGPATKNLRPADITKVSKALQADMPDCTHLRGLRIHTSFTTDLPNNYTFLESRDFLKNRKAGRYIKLEETYPYTNYHLNTLYAGNPANDFTAALNHIFTSQCEAVIVSDPAKADVTVSGVIKKFHSQVIDKVNVKDDGYSVYGNTGKMNIASIVYVDSTINDTDWTYEEILNIRHQNQFKHDSTYDSALLGGSTEESYSTDIKTYLHNEFLLSQYSQVTSVHHVDVLILPFNSSTVESTFKIYNDDDGTLIREFKNIDHSAGNRNTSDYNLFNQYRRLYTTGFGNLLYLINDYAKQVIERIPYEQR